MPSESINHMLKIMANYSPYLSRIASEEPSLIAAIEQNGYDEAFGQLILSVNVPQKNTDDLKKHLRKVKHQMSLLVALADLTSSWNGQQVTKALSEFADTAVKCALLHLINQAIKRNDIVLNTNQDPLSASGLIVIAMGKWGANELNYSSDIDFIIFYDAALIAYKGRHSPQKWYVDLTQDVVDIIGNRTRDGYVFRCDLRLRPDPGSTRVAVSIGAAEHYYETVGQNWERAAMIKARVMCGDPRVTQHFHNFITPYIWRRYLDFSSINDIHSIKRQIDSQNRIIPDNLYDYNIKLNKGGIREIEFFVQTQQLIWGGHNPSVRARPTCDSLRHLVAIQKISQETCNELTESYWFLRHVEHRLQMVNDQQTHSLPKNADDMTVFAKFCGFDGETSFLRSLSEHLATVQSHYAELFQSSPSLASEHPSAPGNLVFTGTENDPATLRTLKKMGFASNATISETIRGWHYGRYRATRTRHAREMLTELMPHILYSLSQTPYPDVAFRRFDEFLRTLPAGVQLFSLFYNNPKLLDLIAKIMGGYPYLASLLTRMPQLLDYVLSPEFHNMLPDVDFLQQHLSTSLQQAKDSEDVFMICRRWCHDRQFRIGVQFIEKRITGEEAGQHLSHIADVTMHHLFQRVYDDFKTDHGIIANSEFGIIALGKLGSLEMAFRSDIDLIFLYNTHGDEHSTDTSKPMSASKYFARLSRRFINAVTALTRDGKLYEVDIRLRPSGNDGPVASSLQGFDEYYQHSAWAWEFMALMRARWITGSSDSFADSVRQTINKTLTQERDPAIFVPHILDMHERLCLQKPSDNPFDVKRIRGGMVDLEYIVHTSALLHAHNHPELAKKNTGDIILALKNAGIFSKAEAETLSHAMKTYLQLVCAIRLTGDDNPIEANMSNGMKKMLSHRMNADSIKELRIYMLEIYAKVWQIFCERFEERVGE